MYRLRLITHIYIDMQRTL